MVRELLSQSDQNDWRTPRKFLDVAREKGGRAARMACESRRKAVAEKRALGRAFTSRRGRSCPAMKGTDEMKVIFLAALAPFALGGCVTAQEQQARATAEAAQATTRIAAPTARSLALTLISSAG